MTYEMLEAGKDFGRYLDVDGDGIPYRTYPATHPTKGGYFTRGTTRNPYAMYSEAGPDYIYNVQRLLRKFETAKEIVPKPVIREASKKSRFGAIYYGSTSPAMFEAVDRLEQQGLHVDALRVRAFPFHDSIIDFVNEHEHVFLIEQNRDGQLRTLLINEGQIDPAKVTPVLHYDGTPITARFIVNEISQRLSAFNVKPIQKGKAA